MFSTIDFDFEPHFNNWLNFCFKLVFYGVTAKAGSNICMYPTKDKHSRKLTKIG